VTAVLLGISRVVPTLRRQRQLDGEDAAVPGVILHTGLADGGLEERPENVDREAALARGHAQLHASRVGVERGGDLDVLDELRHVDALRAVERRREDLPRAAPCDRLRWREPGTPRALQRRGARLIAP
jgi:hypothetical protein